MAARHEGNWRGAYGSRPAIARREPQPRRLAGEAAGVEPARLVVLDARRQDLAFPGAGRDREAFELGDDRIEAQRAFDLRFGCHALPAQQEAHEVARGHRLDLRAQALDRVAMDA